MHRVPSLQNHHKKVTTLVASFLLLFFLGTPAESAYRGFAGEVVYTSPMPIRIVENGALTVEAKIKNTGFVIWRNHGIDFVALNVSRPFYRDSAMYHPFWSSKYQPALLLEQTVAPGEVGTFRFALSAPGTAGVYNEYFMLSAENKAWMRTSEFSIQMIVGEVAPEVRGISTDETLEEKILSLETYVEAGESQTLDLTLTNEAVLGEEPSIRIGLYKTVEPVIITADTPYGLENPTGGLVATFNAYEKVVSFFDAYSNTFYVASGKINKALPYVKLVPSATSTIFTITNFDNPSKWQKGVNDNRFRGAIEVRYGEKSKRPWVINELPLEHYLKGIKETSEISPAEYQKSIAVAARSYAFWHVIDGAKHRGNNFTLDAVWDQVYRGVNTETLIPSFSRAVDDTKGIVVTYDGDIVFTPYFAQSDGYTRSSHIVWGGKNRPWLQSVPDPTNKGLRLWGHGVGMSARGALIMASRGSSLRDILTHYYTGIMLEQGY